MEPNNDDYYKKIDAEEFENQIGDDEKREEFSSFEIKKVKKFNVSIQKRPEDVLVSTLFEGLLMICIDGSPVIEIHKIKDEWFFVEKKPQHYYKCSQYDGLLKCLENI